MTIGEYQQQIANVASSELGKIIPSENFSRPEVKTALENGMSAEQCWSMLKSQSLNDIRINQKANSVTGYVVILALIFVFALWFRNRDSGNSDLSSSSLQTNIDSARGVKPVESAWDGLTPEVKSYLDSNLRDPNSIELIEVSKVSEWETDKWAQRVKYRSKNGFGGMVPREDTFVIKDGKVVDSTLTSE